MVSPRYKDLQEEVSALSCTPLDTSKMFSLHVAVGFWSTHTVELFSFASMNGSLEPVGNSLSLPALPRSLLLHDFGNAPHLLIGLRDGTLVTYALAKSEFQDKRIFSLGTEPVALTQFEMGENKVVFANGSRAALLYLKRGILQHSSILIKVKLSRHGCRIVTIIPFWCTERLCGCENQLTALAIIFALDNPVRMLYWNGARFRPDAHPNSEYLSVSLR
jgi:hypothetical protein